MAHFDTPVEQYMSSPVYSVEAEASLDEAHQLLLEHKISSLPVVSAGDLVGVMSRSDLLRVGSRNAGNRSGASLLTLPKRRVAEEMTRGVLTVEPDTFVSAAAKLMVKDYVHRVFVIRAGTLLGVFSTLDIMGVIRDKKANEPISKSMSSPIFKVKVTDPISLATERLGKAKVSGLLVVEDDWPVGVFTQAEALESNELARDTPVDEVMNPALVCLPQDTRIHRAASAAISMRVRRVVPVKQREAVGILTGLDFARFAAS